MKIHHIICLVSITGSSFAGSLFAQETPETLTQKINSYKTVKLTTNTESLTGQEKAGLSMLIMAAQTMNDIYWEEAYGLKDTLIEKLTKEEYIYSLMNYGPWDRLDNNKSFVNGHPEKPKGANFYPADMTKQEFDEWKDSLKMSPYTMVRRNDRGKLVSIPYHEYFSEKVSMAQMNLFNASHLLNSSPEFSAYLIERGNALMTDEYRKSDSLWLMAKNSKFDIIIGPIENYEDEMFGIKSAHEAYVLVRDMDWSKKLDKYISFLPELQSNLPISDEYKSELPGSSSQLAVFDAIFYAGDCNAGGKTIAVNLPNDEDLQTKMGTRRSQLKNVMKAKFDNMVMPISKVLIDPSQQPNISFDAFFNDVMFHEVAHGLGIKKTIKGNNSVSAALGASHSALEECKADVLGLFMIDYLFKKKEMGEAPLENYYTTFLASVFRSVRFGASSAHGKANMITFNYLVEKGGVLKNNNNGYYSVDLKKMQQGIKSLAGEILKLQGDGDKEKVDLFVAKYGVVPEFLAADLQRLNKADIPKDIVFEQGIPTLELNKR